MSEIIQASLQMYYFGAIVIVVFCVAFIACKVIAFNRTTYAKQTGKRFLQTREDKGAWGEYLLSRQVERFAPSGKMLFDVYVPRPDGSTSEVDVILIASSGIYVFECKNYSGWIFGDEDGRTWTQTLNKNSKYRFANPIEQNAGHLKALSEYLELSLDAFVSVVVFADKAVLKKVHVSSSNVTKMDKVVTRLRNIEESRTYHLDDADIAYVLDRLEPCAHASDAPTSRTHANRKRP